MEAPEIIAGSRINDETEVCSSCGNVYVVVWVVESENYNDFGLRHCPFCGLLTDEQGAVPP